MKLNGIDIDRFMLNGQDIKNVLFNGISVSNNNLFPSGIVAFWDFSETSAPYLSKEGMGDFPLVIGGGSPVQVNSLPFGKGLQFNGSSDYLKIDAVNVGDLNVSQFGNQVSVVAWLKRPNTSPNSDSQGRFVAGMWREDDNDPKRQYGLFYNLPTYGGQLRACGHVSKTGTHSPDINYSRDYSSSGDLIAKDILRCIGFTYDGQQIKSFVDGISDLYKQYTEPSTPGIGQGLTYSKNPYLFDLGLNNSTIADFTVGAVKLTSGMNNWADGIISGVAVFNRCLSEKEMMDIYIKFKQPSDPIAFFDFEIPNINRQPVGLFGWESVIGSNALNQSFVSGTVNVSFSFTRLVDVTKPSFLYRSASGFTATDYQKPCLIVKTGVKNIKLSDIGNVTFLMNNKLSGNLTRFCIKVDGQWYASSQTFDSGDVGASGAVWTTAILMSLIINKNKENWLLLNYSLGSTLSLGVQPINDLNEFDEVTGFGFFNSSLVAEGVIRIRDLKILPK